MIDIDELERRISRDSALTREESLVLLKELRHFRAASAFMADQLSVGSATSSAKNIENRLEIKKSVALLLRGEEPEQHRHYYENAEYKLEIIAKNMDFHALCLESDLRDVNNRTQKGKSAAS